MNYRCNGIVNGKFANFDLVKEKGKDRNKGTWMPIYIYIYCDIHASLPQGNMMFEVIKRRLSNFLVLTTLYFAWSYKFVTGKTNSTLLSKLFIVFDNVYIVYFCVYICTCVWTRESERERASNMFSQFSCVGTQMNTNIVYQFFLYFFFAHPQIE